LAGGDLDRPGFGNIPPHILLYVAATKEQAYNSDMATRHRRRKNLQFLLVCHEAMAFEIEEAVHNLHVAVFDSETKWVRGTRWGVWLLQIRLLWSGCTSDGRYLCAVVERLIQ
jgi:hypothetical protein